MDERHRPSDELRKWFAHDPNRWKEFESRYREELRRKGDLAQQVHQLEEKHAIVMLLYSAHDERHNQAVALCRYLQGGHSA